MPDQAVAARPRRGGGQPTALPVRAAPGRTRLVRIPTLTSNANTVPCTACATFREQPFTTEVHMLTTQALGLLRWRRHLDDVVEVGQLAGVLPLDGPRRRARARGQQVQAGQLLHDPGLHVGRLADAEHNPRCRVACARGTNAGCLHRSWAYKINVVADSGARPCRQRRPSHVPAHDSHASHAACMQAVTGRPVTSKNKQAVKDMKEGFRFGSIFMHKWKQSCGIVSYRWFQSQRRRESLLLLSGGHRPWARLRTSPPRESTLV